MNLFCVGLSHHNADVEAREYFAGHVESDRALRNCGCNEALVLSTCNRVEVYAASEKRVSTDEIARCLVRDDSPHRFAPPFYRYEGEKCAQHLFRVASGLDSMVVGETEILGQAKKTYEAARATGVAGRFSELFEWPSKFVPTPRLRAAQFRSAQSRSILRTKSLVISRIAKSWYLAPAKRANERFARLFRAVSPICASAIGRQNEAKLSRSP
jgi:hypothetical protein